MGGGLLNLVATGENNRILNSNPSKTFFKTTYAKYTNFGLQRFNIEVFNRTEFSLFSDSKFVFKIPNNGDLLMDTFFTFELPDIYSPLYTIPIPNYQGKPFSDLSGLTYCQPYEFKYIDNLGAQLIRKVSYKIDGRTIQEYSGQYLYSKAQRDLTSDKKELFNEMIGNVTELTDPANYSNNNGNYPSVSWGGLRQADLSGTSQLTPDGLDPSIRARTIFVPLNLWEDFSSHLSFPLIALKYSILEIHVECRPLCEIMKVKDLDYFENWVRNINSNTQLPNNKNDIFKYYNPPDIAPNFNDERYRIFYFTNFPPEGSFAIGDFSYNSPFPITNFNELDTQRQLKINNQVNYAASNIGGNQFTNVTMSASGQSQGGVYNRQMPRPPNLMSTFAFLSQEENRRIAAFPQSYLVKKVYEKTIPLVQGVQKEDVDANGLTVSWMWFFQRTDVCLRNEWSNYSNWLYEDKMPYPCLLIMDLSYSLSNERGMYDGENTYVTPVIGELNDTLSKAYNPCSQYITGPVHPMNEKNIMVDWGLYCGDLERESIFESGVNDYVDKYINTIGAGKDGLYTYNFKISNSQQPSGAMNLKKFQNVYFEFSTINPYREINTKDENEDNLHLKINDCEDNNIEFKDAYKNVDEYYTGAYAGGQFFGVNNPTYKDYNYNYNLHIMEERYNVLQFSNGMASYLFPD